MRVDTVANIAVGVAPWGPFAAEDVATRPSWLAEAVTVAVSERQGLVDPAALEGTVLVVGKDLHRFAFARTAIDALRAVRDDVVTIDMGWPSNDRAYADISTFGASRLLGEAVIEFVDDALRAAVATP